MTLVEANDSAASAGEIAVVTPVLNDWPSLTRLIGELDRLAGLGGRRLRILAVDDGSFPPAPQGALAAAVSGSGAVAGVTVIELACNLGHQRAIAAGLVEAARLRRFEAVVVMDADGEDQPGDLIKLLSVADGGDAIVLALRAHRSEGASFQIFYAVYRLMFRLLTGHGIRFGNFCLIPGRFLNALTHSPATWNSLAAAILRSRLPTISVPTDRGTRYTGRSKMNFLALAVHGLSAISVYIDVMLIRLICAALAIGAVIFAALVVVVCLKLFTGLAIPGWASFMGVSLLVLLFQVLMFASIALFQFLSFRSMPTVIPAAHAPGFIARTFDCEA